MGLSYLVDPLGSQDLLYECNNSRVTSSPESRWFSDQRSFQFEFWPSFFSRARQHTVEGEQLWLSVWRNILTDKFTQGGSSTNGVCIM